MLDLQHISVTPSFVFKAGFLKAQHKSISTAFNSLLTAPPSRIPLQPTQHTSYLFLRLIHIFVNQCSNSCRNYLPISKRVILIYDSNIASIAQDIKLIPNAESYTFYAISAFTLFSSTWDSKPDKPFQLDPDALPSSLSHRAHVPSELLCFLRSQFKFLGSASGRVYNTSRLIESRYVELLEKLSANDGLEHFAVGPLNPIRLNRKGEEKSHGCCEKSSFNVMLLCEFLEMR